MIISTQYDFLLQIEELGRTISNLCTVVPGGVVCFFPSYDYERHVLSIWEQSGLLHKITKKKQVRYNNIILILLEIIIFQEFGSK